MHSLFYYQDDTVNVFLLVKSKNRRIDEGFHLFCGLFNMNYCQAI